ncbi:MAG: hypothetical protein OER21_16380 [Gemmatimonadota bacterium]|nr:hypothetical protein [Gemmatimonadota bacterium]
MHLGVRGVAMLAVTGAASGLACGNPLAVNVMTVGVTGTIVVSPMEQGGFTVKAVNRDDERVVWGSGSSSCQLGLFVRDGDGRDHNIDFRDCTSDLVEQGLAPGDSISETIVWGGWIEVAGELQTLANGEYRVYGVAGDRARSEPLLVRVQVP